MKIFRKNFPPDFGVRLTNCLPRSRKSDPPSPVTGCSVVSGQSSPEVSEFQTTRIYTLVSSSIRLRFTFSFLPYWRWYFPLAFLFRISTWEMNRPFQGFPFVRSRIVCFVRANYSWSRKMEFWKIIEIFHFLDFFTDSFFLSTFFVYSALRVSVRTSPIHNIWFVALPFAPTPSGTGAIDFSYVSDSTPLSPVLVLINWHNKFPFIFRRLWRI